MLSSNPSFLEMKNPRLREVGQHPEGYTADKGYSEAQVPKSEPWSGDGVSERLAQALVGMSSLLAGRLASWRKQQRSRGFWREAGPQC